MDYYFDNMILDGKQIIPDQVDIHTQSDVSMKIHNLSASHSKSSAFITINNIKPQVSNVHFRFARKTFPKLSDEGIANVLVQGNDGITIHISLDLMKQGTENMFQFQLGEVTVDIDQLNIEIVSAKHDFLLKVFSSVYQTRVKRLLEQKISEKIQEIFGRIQDGMNNIMAHYGSPSKLKEVITNKVGNLKSSSKTDVQTPSTTSLTLTASLSDMSSTATTPAARQPTASVDTLPPAYGTPEFPAPAYEEKQEPETMAKHLFKFGFFFPCFWIIGAMIFFMRLEPTPEAECGKTAEEQKDEIELLRTAELKWSKRCGYAILSLIALIGIIILICFAAKVGAFKHRH